MVIVMMIATDDVGDDDNDDDDDDDDDDYYYYDNYYVKLLIQCNHGIFSFQCNNGDSLGWKSRDNKEDKQHTSGRKIISHPSPFHY